MKWQEDPFFYKISNKFQESPFWEFFGFRIDLLGVGEIYLNLDIRKGFLNASGSLHGGVSVALMDTSMGMAVRTASGGSPSVTVNLNVHFLKPVKNNRIKSVGKIINLGNSIVTVEGNLYDDSNQLSVMPKVRLN